MWPFPTFHLLLLKKFYFVDLPCLYRFFAVYFLLAYIYMPNYLLFLSMVHEYAYFLWIYLETGLLQAEKAVWRRRRNLWTSMNAIRFTLPGRNAASTIYWLQTSVCWWEGTTSVMADFHRHVSHPPFSYRCCPLKKYVRITFIGEHSVRIP